MNESAPCFDDLAEGHDLPRLRKGPISVAHIMRWSAAVENWHRMHYDQPYARQHQGLPDVIVNGSWKQTALTQLLVDWVGETGWLWRLDFSFRGMNLPGETLFAWGRVRRKVECHPYGAAEIEVGLVNEAGLESTPGSALVVLPRRGGPAVSYPFPHELGAAIDSGFAA